MHPRDQDVLYHLIASVHDMMRNETLQTRFTALIQTFAEEDPAAAVTARRWLVDHLSTQDGTKS